MKICFYTENYHKGGLDTFLINLINTWPDKQDEITLVCNSTHPGLNSIKKNIYRDFKIKKYNRIFTSHFFQVKNNLLFLHVLLRLIFKLIQYPVLFPWYVISLTIFFKNSAYERLVVVNGGYPASLLCRSALIAWRLSGKRPLGVLNFHNSALKASWHNILIEDLIDKLVMKSSSSIVTVSKNCLESLKIRSNFLDSNNLKYIYNGIQDPLLLDKFKIEKPIKPYCLMLSTYEPRKGHIYLLNAFKDVVKNFDDIQLKIYGYGSFEEKKPILDVIIKHNLSDRVTLGDFEPQKNKLIANAAILVVPSQAFESFGLTIIEAMAFGVPVVTTDVGGMPEVLGDSNAGYVCSKDNYKEFAQAIEAILNDKEHALKLGNNGRLAFKNRFIASKMSKKYYELIKN
ncbi:glycosyltransferase family 4 protein [Gammaproteobacteria bacterium]|nr:glycosyltransferase family 4 protein [Gammaproteobacteria bacterium]